MSNIDFFIDIRFPDIVQLLITNISTDADILADCSLMTSSSILKMSK